jgi:mannose-1-phosphate guanylyltransferase/mannose-6-phosphate isomerase
MTYITQPIPDSPPTPHRVKRPWGKFDQYAHNEAGTVSLMTVQPGQRLSLQAHTARAELWIALDDGAEITLGDEVLHPKAGDELWIPANTPHRLAARDRSVRVLEVAFGNWQQADIIRFADDYARPKAGET